MRSIDPLGHVQTSPEWLAHRYDPQLDTIHFVHVDRQVRAAVPFLTDENLPQARNPVVRPRSEAAAGISPAPLHFIFHSAFCCSTLLANVFNREGLFSSFKEPVILNDIVGWRHRGAPPERVSAALRDALTLLARPLRAGELAIIKPSNVVNALAPAMLAMVPDAGALLLYAPLPLFLGSIASKGLWGRLWVRDLLAKQLRDGIVDLGLSAEEIFLQSDLQVAASGWLVQQQLFAGIAQRWPDRVRSLNSETLLATPTQAVAALCTQMRVKCSNVQVAELVKTNFGRHAKFGESFSRADRVENQRGAAAAHADELEKVTAWAEELASRAEIPMELPRPLLPAP